VAGALIALSVGSCHDGDLREHADGLTPETVTLVFQIELDRQAYENSAWGDPPQMAVWLQDEAGEDTRTVAVTHRMGAGDWEGKVECAVALPAWVAFYNRETGTQGPPTWDHPAPDAITCATPRATLNATIRVPRDTRWTYFVEVNVSGDYSAHFPRMSEDGRSDRYGNGQPSIVYRGSIEAIAGATGKPELWGRTDQHVPLGTVSTDLVPITTARGLLRSVRVRARQEVGGRPQQQLRGR
jgi:hypothetical protein